MCEATKITVEGTKCLYLNDFHISKMDLAKLLIANNVHSESLPAFTSLYSTGTYIYTIPFGVLFKRVDVSYDSLRPWNSSSNRTKKDNIAIDGEECACYRSKHPMIEGLRKMIIVSETKAILAYMFSEVVDFSQAKPFGKHVKPSTVATVKEALEFRSVKDTQRVLQSKDVDLSENKIRNISRKIDTCVKGKTGPVSMTCLDQLAGAIFPFDGYLQVEKVEEKPNITAIVVFEDALKVYARDCPTAEQVSTFRKYMKNAIESDTAPSADSYNSSQFIIGMESQLSVDTTFDLSHLFATFIIGKLGTYKTKKSMKDRPILLAVMIHSNKRKESHILFGEKFAASWNKVAKGKVVPSIIKDGETALEEITKNSVFDQTLRLRCDLHLCENLLGRNSISSKEADVLFGKLEKDCKLRPGLFQQPTREAFSKFMEKIGHKYPEMYKKMKPKEDQLFASHSQETKFYAGFGGRYSTTNISECYNEMIKKYVTKKYEMREIHLSKTSESEVVVAIERKPFQILSEKDKCEEELTDISLFQESFVISSSDTSDLFFIPKEILANLSGLEKEKIIEEQMHLFATPGPLSQNWYIVSNDVNDDFAKVTPLAKKIICSFPSCRMEKFRFFPCQHVLCVLRSRKECHPFWAYFKEVSMKHNYNDIQKAAYRKGDGSKRKGKQESKTNYKRKCIDLSERNAVDSTLEEMDLASSREETIHSDEEQFLSSYLSRSAASFSRFYDSN